jgi:hypothetical protein
VQLYLKNACKRFSNRWTISWNKDLEGAVSKINPLEYGRTMHLATNALVRIDVLLLTSYEIIAYILLLHMHYVVV